MLTEALQLSNDTVSHIPLHDQSDSWAMKKNVERWCTVPTTVWTCGL